MAPKREQGDVYLFKSQIPLGFFKYLELDSTFNSFKIVLFATFKGSLGADTLLPFLDSLYLGCLWHCLDASPPLRSPGWEGRT